MHKKWFIITYSIFLHEQSWVCPLNRYLKSLVSSSHAHVTFDPLLDVLCNWLWCHQQNLKFKTWEINTKITSKQFTTPAHTLFSTSSNGYSYLNLYDTASLCNISNAICWGHLLVKLPQKHKCGKYCKDFIPVKVWFFFMVSHNDIAPVGIRTSLDMILMNTDYILMT